MSLLMGYVLNESSLLISELISPSCRRELTPPFCFREPLLSDLLVTSESPNYYLHEETNKPRTAQREVKAREHEIVRKGIDRLEMQILQYINLYVSKD